MLDFALYFQHKWMQNARGINTEQERTVLFYSSVLSKYFISEYILYIAKIIPKLIVLMSVESVIYKSSHKNKDNIFTSVIFTFKNYVFLII